LALISAYYTSTFLHLREVGTDLGRFSMPAAQDVICKKAVSVKLQRRPIVAQIPFEQRLAIGVAQNDKQIVCDAAGVFAE
jgi:4-hydroxy-3-methylbut-2-en-1-yl diphosphate synthase IspG/GcpE